MPKLLHARSYTRHYMTTGKCKHQLAYLNCRNQKPDCSEYKKTALVITRSIYPDFSKAHKWILSIK